MNIENAMPKYEYVVVTKQYRTVIIEAESIQDGIDAVWDDVDNIYNNNVYDCDTDVLYEREVGDE